MASGGTRTDEWESLRTHAKWLVKQVPGKCR